MVQESFSDAVLQNYLGGQKVTTKHALTEFCTTQIDLQWHKPYI